MTEGFRTDPELLRRTADRLGAVADDLHAAVSGFTEGLGGDPWGTDMLGVLIGGGYVAVERLALDTLDAAVAGLDSIAGGLETMAATYEEADGETEAAVERVAGALADLPEGGL